MHRCARSCRDCWARPEPAARLDHRDDHAQPEPCRKVHRGRHPGPWHGTCNRALPRRVRIADLPAPRLFAVRRSDQVSTEGDPREAAGPVSARRESVAIRWTARSAEPWRVRAPGRRRCCPRTSSRAGSPGIRRSPSRTRACAARAWLPALRSQPGRPRLRPAIARLSAKRQGARDPSFMATAQVDCPVDGGRTGARQPWSAAGARDPTPQAR